MDGDDKIIQNKATASVPKYYEHHIHGEHYTLLNYYAT